MSAVLLNPAISGTLLFAATLAPAQFREPLLAKLREYATNATIEKSVVALQWLFGLGIVASINRYLTRLGGNNFRLSHESSRYVWKDEIVLITGGTGGFGGRISKDLASRGLTVIAVDVRDDMPADMKAFSKIHYYKCNIADRDAVFELQKTIKREHGDPSILINNAGLGASSPILEVEPEKLKAIYSVNTQSHWWTVQAFLPAMMKAKKGQVVTIASVASFVAPQFMSEYSGTKASAMAFHECLTNELRTIYKAPQIRTVIVHPTFASTPMVAPYEKDLKTSKQKVIDPKIVTDAIVKRILSCNGGQLIIAPGTEFISTIRSWPSWIYHGGLILASKYGGAPMMPLKNEY
nr:dehydrogenase red2 [Quercus suber]